MTKKLPFSLSNKHTNRIATALIAVGVLLAIVSVWKDTIIIDEDPHIGAGYSYVAKQDMRLNPEHPPLAKDLAAVPLLFLNLNEGAFSSKPWVSDINGQWEFGRRLMFNSGNDATLITHAAKLPMLLLFIIAACVLFGWARERYGNRAALIALTLFVFSPTVLAHARFVTTDIAALTGVLTATYTFLKYLKQPTRGNFWLAAVVFGLALLMKFSTILLVPFFGLVAILWNWKFIGRTILIMIVGFVVVVWPVYYFHVFNYPPARQHNDTQMTLRSYGNRMFAGPVVWASDKPVIRAAAQYGLGLLMVVQRSSGGNTVYFNGTVSTSAGPIYFPYVYAIKEPLPWLILLVVAIVISLSKIQITKSKLQHWKVFVHTHIDEVAMLLWLAVYWATSIHSTLNIGVRHLLPVYPFMIILTSVVIARITRRSKVALWAVVVLLGWYVVENARVFPYYLTYFNETVGGPAGGHNHVVDSNLDWGQDLGRFSSWVIERNIPKIELDYFGWADPSYYLKDRFLWLTSDKYENEADFLNNAKSNGWIAVSATYLMNNYRTKYAWLYRHEPVAIIGNSIFVYHLTP